MTTRSVLTTTPENTSILQPTKFTFFIPDKPFLKYFCQTVVLPSVSLTPIEVSTPFVNTFRHGSKMSFEPLSVTALMDEDLRVWHETYNWMNSLGQSKDLTKYPKQSLKDSTPLYFDGILTINTNANKPNIRFKFKNCHPIDIGAINFDTKTDADTIPTADFTFRYDYYEIERL